MKKKILMACIVGNALEIYDFVLYGIFSLNISQTFFPNHHPAVALISTLGIFSAGFLMRPLGGILFGHLGDTLGRKRALTISMLVMTISTFSIGILPSYAQIGILASILLVLCRLMQGLSSGGEYTGATIFVLENYQYKKRGIIGAAINASSGMGSILATLTGFIVLQQEMPSWAWRVPFLLGSAIGFAGYYVRVRFNESPEFLNLRKKEILKAPLKSALTNNTKSVFCASGIAACSISYVYIQLVYMNIYLNKVVGISLSDSILYTSIGLIVCFLFTFVSGALSERFSKQKVMSIFAILSFVTAYPNFMLLQTGTSNLIIISQILFGLLAGGFLGPMNALLVDLFPANTRYSGLGFSFSCGQSIMGATPLVATLLIHYTNNPLSPSFYVMFCSMIGLSALYFSDREKALNGSFSNSNLVKMNNVPA